MIATVSLRAGLAGCLVLALAACTSDEPAAPVSAPATTPASPPSSAPSPSAGGIPALADTPVKGTGHTMKAPPGWTVAVWAQVPGARLLAWTPDGKLLVSRPKFGDVIALTGGKSSTLIRGLNQPHGLAFSADGGTLYVAQSDQLDSFTYKAGAVSGHKVVAAGLPDAKSPELGGAYAHALKSVAVGRDGTLYISVGSTGNVSAIDRSATPERATILKVAPGGGTPTTFAHGVRNGTGLAVDPTGAVWTAVNNRDNIAFPYDRDYDGDGSSDQGKVDQSYVNDHPLEPLARLTQGRDLGWPYCNPDPDVRPGVQGSPLDYTRRPYVRDVENNPDGKKLDCAKLAPPEQGLPAHSAPLGLSFATSPGLPGAYGPGALVGVHGSWNRKPPQPPEVTFFPWRDDTLGPRQTLLSGFQDDSGSRWGRPVMAVQGPDQALYVSDDLAGAIYRVQPG